MKTHKICGNCRNLVKGELNNIPFVACKGNVDNPDNCALAMRFYKLKMKDTEFLCPREGLVMFAHLKALDIGIKNACYNRDTAREFLENLGYKIEIAE